MDTMWKKRLLTYTPALIGALIFLLPFERIPSFDLALGTTNITIRLSQLVGLALWVIVIIALKPKSISLQLWKKQPPYIKLILLFIGTTMLSSLAASFSLKRALVVWLFTVFTIGVGLIVGKLFRTKDTPSYMQYLAAGTWVVIIFGFYQFFGDVLGLSNATTGLRDLYTYNVLGFTRVQSTALEPLYLANFLLIPLFIFLASYIYGASKRPWLLLLGTTIFTLTVSRGAYIAALCGLVAMVGLLFWKRPNTQTRNYVQAALLVALGVVLAYTMTSLIVSSKRDKNAPPPSEAVVKQATNLDAQDDRVRNRQLAFDAFKTRPVLGIGPGNFDNYARQSFPVYQSLAGNVIVNNEPLELLAETGIIGFALLVASMSLLLREIVLRLKAEKNLSLVALSVGLIAFLFALVVQFLTFSTLYIMHVWVAIGLLWGIAAQPREKAQGHFKK